MAKYDRKMQDLKTRLSEIYDIDMMQSLLGWDQSTYMPKGRGARGRSLHFWASSPSQCRKTGQTARDLQPTQNPPL